MTHDRVLVTGADGQLGRSVVSAFDQAGWEVSGPGHGVLDITDPQAVRDAVGSATGVVVNSAAWTDVDGCARDPERALEINGTAAGNVAAAARTVGALAVQISTNEVFDGTATRPYREDDEPNPINPYGGSKLAGEFAASAANPRHLIVRTAWIFGPGGSNFPTKILRAAKARMEAGEPLSVVSDEVGNPTWAPDLAAAILWLVVAERSGEAAHGVWHICGEPPVSRFEWARQITTGLGGVDLRPISSADYPRPSRPPLRAVLDTRKAQALGVAELDWRRRSEAFVGALSVWPTTAQG